MQPTDPLVDRNTTNLHRLCGRTPALEPQGEIQMDGSEKRKLMLKLSIEKMRARQAIGHARLSRRERRRLSRDQKRMAYIAELILEALEGKDELFLYAIQVVSQTNKEANRIRWDNTNIMTAEEAADYKRLEKIYGQRVKEILDTNNSELRSIIQAVLKDSSKTSLSSPTLVALLEA